MRSRQAASPASPAPLVGRDGELQRLQSDLARARTGQARIAVVTGEAGVGKSRLCREVAARASGFHVVGAAGEESEVSLGLGVLDELFAGLGAGPASAPGTTPLAAGAALVRALSDAQGERPLLLWVDDLHWVDAPTQQALIFALRRLAADTACALLSVRVGEEHRLLPGLLRLFEEPEVTRVDLTGLGLEATARLADALGRSLPMPALRRIRDHTGGNPLWTTALLREATAEALADPTGALPAPRSFAALTTSRLRGLDVAARSLVEICSVAGVELPLAVAAHAADVADPYPALAAGRHAGLLHEVAGTPPRVRTAHALVTSAVYAGLDPARRAALHRRLAQLVGLEHDRLRHEVAAAPGPDDDLADRLAAQGRERAGRGMWVGAVESFRTAARLRSDADSAWQLNAEAASAALMSGDPLQARDLLELLDDSPSRPRADCLRGWAAMVDGHLPEAEALLRRAVAESSAAGDAAVLAEASSTMAHVLTLLGRSSEGVGYARAALDLVPAASDLADTARATLLMTLATLGRHGEVEELAAGVDAAHLQPHDVTTVIGRGAARVFSGRFRGAVADLGAAIHLAREMGDFHLLCVAHSQLSQAYGRLGEWDAALVHAEQSVRIVRDAELVWAAGAVHAHAAYVYSRRGQWPAATRHVQASVAAAARTGEPMSLCYAHTAAAVLAHSRTDPAGVIEAGQFILQLRHRDGIDEPGNLEWPTLYLESLVGCGRLAEADATLTAYEAAAARGGVLWAISAGARVRGLLEAARSRVDEAVGHLERATALADEAATPFEAALARLDLGTVLTRRGRRGQAAHALTEALATFDGLGAAPFSERARAGLSALGAVPRLRAPAPATRLTPQELAVARLVRQGLSNRDIAAELFLSTKTVEFHLRNAFLKLGVSSRTQLVARLASEGSWQASEG